MAERREQNQNLELACNPQEMQDKLEVFATHKLARTRAEAVSRFLTWAHHHRPLELNNFLTQLHMVGLKTAKGGEYLELSQQFLASKHVEFLDAYPLIRELVPLFMAQEFLFRPHKTDLHVQAVDESVEPLFMTLENSGVLWEQCDLGVAFLTREIPEQFFKVLPPLLKGAFALSDEQIRKNRTIREHGLKNYIKGQLRLLLISLQLETEQLVELMLDRSLSKRTNKNGRFNRELSKHLYQSFILSLEKIEYLMLVYERLEPWVGSLIAAGVEVQIHYLRPAWWREIARLAAEYKEQGLIDYSLGDT